MQRLRRWSGTLVTTALVTGLAADTAAARITPTGIAGVEIGADEADVRAALGRPSSVTGSEGNGTRRLDYTRRKMDVLLRDDVVIRLRTRSRAQKTAAGVGPGVAESTMRRKLREEICGTARGARVCSTLDGPNVVAFVCRSGRVAVAEVSRAEM